MANSPITAAATLLLTPKAAAELLAISPRKLWSLTRAREVACVRVGRSVRYKPDDLTAWIEKHRTPAREVQP
ncbi:MAG: helix-turn-helix domain-containing protein [Planctomycetaceae bacterium]|nr:helix-turn-helix domain-containing protein [Planctomycetaceae bacterium]